MSTFSEYQPTVVERAFEAFKDAVQVAFATSPLEGLRIERNLSLDEALDKVEADDDAAAKKRLGAALINLADDRPEPVGDLLGEFGGKVEFLQRVRLEVFVRAKKPDSRSRLTDWILSILASHLEEWQAPPDNSTRELIAPAARILLRDVARGITVPAAPDVLGTAIPFGLHLEAKTLLG